MLRIAIDLTPILPGGDNGGAKIMSLQLIRQLADFAKDIEFIILTSKSNHQELSSLKASNIKTVCLTSPLSKILLSPVWFLSKLFLSSPIKMRLRHFKHHAQTQLDTFFSLKKITLPRKPDLIFCPFTKPNYRYLNIPIVSVIYDLQSFYHPEFFTSEELFERKKNFELACRWAQKLICISEFTRQTVLQNSNLPAQNIQTIPIRLAHRLPCVEQQKIIDVLKQFGLTKQNYLLFPANFWPHKNHKTLFEAFKIYRTKNPTSTLKLVCTGANNDHKKFLLNRIRMLGLAEWILLPDYLPDDSFAGLIHGSKAIIFPSLYEGFGMPLLEAMAASKPVLCSNITSMPEIAEAAALLFDPRNPNEIAEAICRIEHEPQLAEKLIKLGNERLAAFGTDKDMTNEYLQIFREIIHLRSLK